MTGDRGEKLAFDQADVTGARALAGFLRREFHPLSFAQQLEYGAANGTAMEEMFGAALIADEAETLVDEQACDSPGSHNRVLRCARQPETIPGAFRTAMKR